jgi:hypothetical protein
MDVAECANLLIEGHLDCFQVLEFMNKASIQTFKKKKKKMWYLYTIEFFSATKKNEILSFSSKWIELENIILSEVSQAQKAKSCMFSFICRL